MAYSDRSTSPDPLATSGSPLAARTRSSVGRRSSRPLAPRSNNVVSPSKSFIMDTGKAGDVSPWRIKVTVEAEPKDGTSPAKRMTRTTTVPLKGGSSSSPTKRGSPAKNKAVADDETDFEIKRPQRKRKGTPIRRAPRRSQPPESMRAESARGTTPASGQIEMSQKLQEELSSPVKLPSTSRSKTSRAGVAVQNRSRSSATKQDMRAAPEQNPGKESDESEDDDNSSIADHAAGDMTVANEDFTMVSVETLESMKQNTSLLDHSGIDKSVASVSYMPSSPPQAHVPTPSRDRDVVQYPSISVQAREAKLMSSGAQNKYGANPTEPRQSTSSGPQIQSSQLPQDILRSEPTEWRLERQAVSQQIENASASQVIVIDDETQAGADEDRMETEDDAQDANESGAGLDIWAEEASRSLEEDSIEQHYSSQSKQPESRPPQLEDLFVDQPLKPPRPKIPRTWRRTSGVDFSYVDSPEHGALTGRKPSANSTDAEAGGRGSSAGVLTPPESSEDESAKADEEGEGYEEGDTSLTQPDAAATQLQDNCREPFSSSHASPNARDVAISPVSDSSSNSTTPDGGDTGLFWQSNLPNVYKRPVRPRLAQKPRAMDLSELLNLDKSGASPERKEVQRGTESKAAPYGRAFVAKASLYRSKPGLSQPSQSKVVSSPLRRSLLRSSKIGGSALPSPATLSSPSVDSHTSQEVEQSATDESIGTSFESKASDQRQLLAEMGMATGREDSTRLQDQWEEDFSGVEAGESTQSRGSEMESGLFEDEEEEESSIEEQERETTAGTCPSRSYEEHLNVDSPQKIRVNFNDSEGNSSVLVPRKEYPPLFGKSTATEHQDETASPPSVTLVSKKPAAPVAEAQPGIFSRLSSNFWSAVIRPSGPVLVDPTAPTPEPEYSPSLRAHIRSRYGVVSDQHPWTMTHMRTLHRLLNSCTSNMSDSIVPKTGPLPSALKDLIGKDIRCVGTFCWTFTEQHAHVVDAFMQTIVPKHYVDAMRRGEVTFIGDSEAKKYRGLIKGRHGDDHVFTDYFWIWLPKGKIEGDFVVKALGNCVCANIITAEREAEEAERARRIKEERRAWERKNGMFYDDDEDESYVGTSEDRSEVLEKVRQL